MDGSRLSYAALLTLILLLAAIALTYTMVVSGLNVAGCGDRCDYPSITRAMNGFLVAAGLSLTIAVAGSYLLRAKGWWVLIAPVAGALVLVLAFWVTSTIARTATQL